MKTKQELLKHYETREPTEFVQMDIFAGEPNSYDGLATLDENGLTMWELMTTELMTGSPAVRVLIRPGIDKTRLTLALAKILHAVQSAPEGDYFDQVKKCVAEPNPDYQTENRKNMQGLTRYLGLAQEELGTEDYRGLRYDAQDYHEKARDLFLADRAAKRANCGEVDPPPCDRCHRFADCWS